MSGNPAQMKSVEPGYYLATWMIDVEAKNPREAAIEALNLLVDEDEEMVEKLTGPSALSVWTVFDHVGTRTDVDLSLDEVENQSILWWVSVPVCDRHWNMLERDLEPVRIVDREVDCVKCDEPANIWIRAEMRVPK